MWHVSICIVDYGYLRFLWDATDFAHRTEVWVFTWAWSFPMASSQCRFLVLKFIQLERHTYIYTYIHPYIPSIHPSIHIYILYIDLGDHWITGLFLGTIVANCFCFFVAKRWQKTCWVSAASPQWPGTQVGYEVLRWEEGKVIAFDDTFIHQASLESLESWFPGAPEFFVEIFVGGWELLDSWCFIDFQRV